MYDMTIAPTAVGCAQQCTPAFPASDEGRNYSTFAGGRQLLFPSRQFNCPGIVTEMRAQVIGTSTSGIYFQIWRPKSIRNGTYELVWSRDSGLSRVGNTILIMPLIRGIPVRQRDVIGMFLAEENFIGVQFKNGTDVVGTVFYAEGDGPLCNFSLCDPDVHNMTDTSPFIDVTFGKFLTALFYFCLWLQTKHVGR